MAGLKSVFCESIKKWGMGGLGYGWVFFPLGVWDWFQKLIWQRGNTENIFKLVLTLLFKWGVNIEM